MEHFVSNLLSSSPTDVQSHGSLARTTAPTLASKVLLFPSRKTLLYRQHLHAGIIVSSESALWLSRPTSALRDVASSWGVRGGRPATRPPASPSRAVGVGTVDSERSVSSPPASVAVFRGRTTRDRSRPERQTGSDRPYGLSLRVYPTASPSAVRHQDKGGFAKRCTPAFGVVLEEVRGLPAPTEVWTDGRSPGAPDADGGVDRKSQKVHPGLAGHEFPSPGGL